MTCLDCLHCKNPTGFLICKQRYWQYADFSQKKIILQPKEQESRDFMPRKLLARADRCFDYNNMKEDLWLAKSAEEC